MLKHNGSDKSAVGTNRDTERMQALRGLSNLELLDGIDKMLDCGDGLPDADELELYLKTLQEKAPVMEDYDPEAEWNRLMADHPEFAPEEEPAAPKTAVRKRFCLRLGAAAAVLVVFLGVSAAAYRNKSFSGFVDWAQGIMQIHSEPSGVMELPADDPSEYHSLAEALTANGVDPSGCPTWIPEDYKLEDVRVIEKPDFMKISALYSSNRGELYIRIIKYDEVWSKSLERDDNAVLFEDGGKEYWLISNLELEKANWKDAESTYSLSGQITNNEIKKIIMSIPKGE